jgi:hypothetical protein
MYAQRFLSMWNAEHFGICLLDIRVKDLSFLPSDEEGVAAAGQALAHNWLLDQMRLVCVVLCLYVCAVCAVLCSCAVATLR